ncbi:MAG: IS1595 family transposase [Alphaproteobacteria bacterium]|nr:IS1595 family transposase [Alphaproteobacteria bacterium]
MALTVTDFFRKFPTDDACLDHLWKVRFGDEIECGKCGKVGKFYRLRKELAYSCPRCGHHIHPMVGTPFERSRTPLQKWFYAIYLFTTTRHGVSAKELQRQLGVTYKTAWRMRHEIRKYMAQVDGDGMLDAHVEMDEAYIGGRRVGGKQEGKTGRGGDKAIVFGMVKREGEVITAVVASASKKDMLPHVADHVVPGTHVFTDEWPPYKALPGMGYSHKAVSHRAKRYVEGIDHVKTIEGFWAILQRSIRGTHVWVSPKHLSKYLGEFEYRFNIRKRPASMFYRLLTSF